MNAVGDDGGEDRAKLSHAVVEVGDPDGAVFDGAAVALLERGVGVPFRPPLRQRRQTGCGLRRCDLQDVLFELAPHLWRLDDGPGRDDRPHVRDRDHPGIQCFQCPGVVVHEGCGFTHLSLHGAVADPQRRADLGRDRPVRETGIRPDPTGVGFFGPVRRDRLCLRQRAGFLSIEPGFRGTDLDQFRQQQVHPRVSPKTGIHCGFGHDYIIRPTTDTRPPKTTPIRPSHMRRT